MLCILLMCNCILRFPELHSECIGIVSQILNNELDTCKQVTPTLTNPNPNCIHSLVTPCSLRVRYF